MEGSFVLFKEPSVGLFSLYKGGYWVDYLSENYEYPGQKKATLEIINGKLYLDSTEVVVTKDLLKNINEGKSHISHSSHFSSNSNHSSHYSQIINGTHGSHYSHSSHASHYSSSF